MSTVAKGDCICDSSRACKRVQVMTVDVPEYCANDVSVTMDARGWWVHACQRRVFEAARALAGTETPVRYEIRPANPNGQTFIVVALHSASGAESPAMQEFFVQMFRTIDAAREYLTGHLGLRVHLDIGKTELWW